jgi:hypothetical protein
LQTILLLARLCYPLPKFGEMVQALCSCHLLRINAASLLHFLSLLQHDNSGRFSLLLCACTITAPHDNNSRVLHLLLSCTGTNIVIGLPSLLPTVQLFAFGSLPRYPIASTLRFILSRAITNLRWQIEQHLSPAFWTSLACFSRRTTNPEQSERSELKWDSTVVLEQD